MSINPLNIVLEAGLSLLDRFVPDPLKKIEEQRKLIEIHQKGDITKLNAHVALMSKQADINLADANSGNSFQSNWRPMIGWVGAISLALSYIPKSIFLTYIWVVQNLKVLDKWDGLSPLTIAAFPDLGVTDIIALLGSMLGVAAMRSYDKKNGIDTK